MFGNRELLIGYQIRQREGDIDNANEASAFVCRICNQAKLISQIISFIWLWVDYQPENDALYPDEDENTKLNKKMAAEKLKEIFDAPYHNFLVDHQLSPLMKLLHTKPSFMAQESDGASENPDSQKLLDLIFDHYKKEDNLDDIFPIFNKYEVGLYNVFVDCEHFHGQLSDPTANDPQKMAFSIPYPPRPILGAATLTQKDLIGWLEDTNRKKYVAENPYIPTTCS